VALPSAYAILLAAGWILAALRREMTMVRVSSLLWLTAGFLVADLARHVAGWGEPSVLGSVLLAVALVLWFRLRRWWVIGGFDEAEARAVIEGSMDQLRLAFERHGWGYALRTKAGEGQADLKRLPGKHGAFCLVGDRQSAKVLLLRSLLAKRFARLLPRPHIRFR